MCSATEIWFAAGVYVTRMPLCEAAAKIDGVQPRAVARDHPQPRPCFDDLAIDVRVPHKKRVSVRYPSLQCVAVANREAANLEPLRRQNGDAFGGDRLRYEN